MLVVYWVNYSFDLFLIFFLQDSTLKKIIKLQIIKVLDSVEQTFKQTYAVTTMKLTVFQSWKL